MNKEIGKITRQKGHDYKVDRQGNIIESKYSYLKDPYTYITIILIVMAWLYWSEVKTARQFAGSPCVEKCMIDNYVHKFNLEHPDVRLSCDYDSKRCTYDGYLDSESTNGLSLKGFNLTQG